MARIIQSDGNVILDSTPVGANVVNTIDPINIRRNAITNRETLETNYITINIGSFNKDGDITLYGDYQQNSIDIPKFNLSQIQTLDNKNALFNFILVIKDGDESVPDIYASNKVYTELIDNYNNNNPIPTNYLINERKIVVVDIKPLKEKIEELRSLELGINLSQGTGFVEVYRNLFVKSNYEPDGTDGLKANPSVSIVELIKYISWVISKPNSDYESRLLDVRVIGNFKNYLETIEEPTDDDTPSEETTSPTYPPFERPGAYSGESLLYNDTPYIWDSQINKWIIDLDGLNDIGSGNQGDQGDGGTTDPQSATGNTTSYSPIGRAGVYQFEIESPNGVDFYEWNGTMWVYLPDYDDSN